MTWRNFAPDDPKGLRPFVEDLVNRLIERRGFTVSSDEEAEKIFDEVHDEMMTELRTHIETWQDSNKKETTK